MNKLIAAATLAVALVAVAGVSVSAQDDASASSRSIATKASVELNLWMRTRRA